jgi:putative transposase
VRPDTVLRWHHDLVAARHARVSRPKRVGRPRTVRSIRVLVLRLARENTSWGYRRIHGELLVLGIKVAASTVWEILKDAGIDPAPERSSQTWAVFLRSQAEAILAADFFEAVTLTGSRIYVLAVIEHATRRVRVLGATAHPDAAWVTQAVRNLAMDLQDAASTARFLIRDRDGKCPTMFDMILADTGIKVVLSGVRTPRMNSIMERWIQSCRHELLDRTLVWNQAHPAARPAPVRTALQRSPTPSRHLELQATASTTRSDHRSRRDHTPHHSQTRPPGRHHPRIRARRMTSADGVIGTRNVRHTYVPSPPGHVTRRLESSLRCPTCSQDATAPPAGADTMPRRWVAWNLRQGRT